MWVLRVKVVHNCVIGNRARKYKCWSYSLPFGNWIENGYSFTAHLHTIEGPNDKVEEYLKDLKKDKELAHYERFGNTVFLVQKRKTKDVIIAHHNNTLFMTKPFYTSAEGNEYVEYCSWNKQNLMAFLKSLTSTPGMKVTVEKFSQTKLGDIYVANPLPKLSKKQREALQLAITNGYYKYPRKIEMQELAKMMKVSNSTFNEHLRKAEEKMMPSPFDSSFD